METYPCLLQCNHPQICPFLPQFQMSLSEVGPRVMKGYSIKVHVTVLKERKWVACEGVEEQDNVALPTYVWYVGNLKLKKWPAFLYILHHFLFSKSHTQLGTLTTDFWSKLCTLLVLLLVQIGYLEFHDPFHEPFSIVKNYGLFFRKWWKKGLGTGFKKEMELVLYNYISFLWKYVHSWTGLTDWTNQSHLEVVTNLLHLQYKL